MNVLLVNVDSTIPNLALMKISQYHKQKGDNVGFNIENPDMIYISCIFKKNKEKVQSSINLLKLQYPEAVIEGGGRVTT